jgi:ferric-dicitrate binding protein FerR (iron transport regulator)
MITEEIIKNIPPLVIKYLRNKLNKVESASLGEWVNASSENNIIFEELIDIDKIRKGLEDIYSLENKEAACLKKIKETLVFNDQPKAVVNRSFMWYRYAIAAAILILVAGLWNIFQPATRQADKPKHIVKDISAPTGINAKLQLADSSIIVLDSVHNGDIVLQGTTQIQKQDSQIIYHTSLSEGTKAKLFNKASTSRGGFLMLILPDGSKAWLNAESSIYYPVAFTGNERKVFITGEVYFEIHKNAKQPFKVVIPGLYGNTGKQEEIEVIGTHFNVNAYKEEATVTTTLLEGSIKFTQTKGYSRLPRKLPTILKPGQQVLLSDNEALKVREADTAAVIAWKSHDFIFTGAQDIQAAMRQIARWYNVEVIVDKKAQQFYIQGQISKRENLLRLFSILEELHTVKFKLEGSKVTVLPWDVKP